MATAGPGHDHGEEAAAGSTGKASPRFTAHSDLFEVVGVLGSGELSIVIDRYATNEAVLDAKVEIESGTYKAVATFHADRGAYGVPAAPFAKSGTYPITLTIMAGKDTDLLAGDLVVADHTESHMGEGQHPTAWKKWLLRGLGALALLAGAVLILRWIVKFRTV
jgi:hypothetical protein